MGIIGRRAEMDRLDRLCGSSKAEFAVVYGRRRVGKTYLVREYFKGSFAFYVTGVAGGGSQVQLKSFNGSLQDAGGEACPDWFEAFREMRRLLEREDVRRDAASGKRIVFIDEMPWLAAPRTDFMAALELFWNQWGSAQPDLLLIACGSATSWIVKNLLRNHGGLHNRVTARIKIEPFTLAECEEYYSANGHVLAREQMIESYMVFGGVPYYLDLLDRRMSLVQNIDHLCFAESGDLVREFDDLYLSLFKHADRHISIVRALASKAKGLTLQEISSAAGIAMGGTLTKTLDELEASGFLRRYLPFGKAKRGSLYQLIDPFSLFYLRFMDSRARPGFWQKTHQAPRVNSWRGHAFELVCLLHEEQIERALGISAIASEVGSWRSVESEPGAQIDLVIDRADGVINLCEMKWCAGEFAITRDYDLRLRNKLVAFSGETGTRKAIHLTMVAPFGVKRNAYSETAQSVVTADDLFRLPGV